MEKLFLLEKLLDLEFVQSIVMRLSSFYFSSGVRQQPPSLDSFLLHQRKIRFSEVL